MIPFTKETNLAAMLIIRKRKYLKGEWTGNVLFLPPEMYEAWVDADRYDVLAEHKVAHKYQYDIMKTAEQFIDKHHVGEI